MLPQLVLESIAQTAHEVNQAYCRFTGMAMPPWADCSSAHKSSLIKGVLGILDGRFSGPADQHACWLDTKIAEGWVYGPEKDEARKTHPCLIPYDELPTEQRVKDSLFRAVVLESARMLGVKAVI